ncbi:trafficking kinesin-binding protein milt isoform X2 [Neocloeon triangulifer]|uniref:trafficking kinesin-binding protein milt isoform X2 n=1 Tax=Neocloeon triangulifer TaxID=2078957 RepID=UPI00286F33B7|nr:trafficking kinesin-binding protein milt isoform X2 [Neocloeon triangulifer]XP_059489310.1 trafficking kinesin-binding protein milt isoform X2 [Neocloeon triangulifer]XP_059489311.1 trafficking kinesin-binding protein milt isoform X2 [Neocloeon triangulifer]
MHQQGCSGEQQATLEGHGQLPTDIIFHVARDKDRELYLRFISIRLNQVLSGKRLSQMTKTYNDPEAVTRLLEEKEKDLELTARIGQELLAHNNQLEAQVAALEVQLKEQHDQLVQTQHELHSKAELLAIIAAEDDPTSDPNTPTATKSISVDLLQRKVATLEVQNTLLKAEATQIANETAVVEEKEKQLLDDITTQLTSVNRERSNLAEDNAKYKEENRVQHEEIRSLQARLASLKESNSELTNDNTFLAQQVATTKQTQDLLCAEILELKEQYAQVLGLLNEAQDQIRKMRKKQLPTARLGAGEGFQGNYLNSSSLSSNLGAELVTSLVSDSSLDSGISVGKPQVPSYRRVFETVRSASRAASNASTKSHSPASHMFNHNSSTMLTSTSSSGPKMSLGISGPSSGSSWPAPPMAHEPVSDILSLRSSEVSLSEEMGISAPQLGIPGQPGSLDFKVALGNITAQDVLLKRQRMGLVDIDGDSFSSESYQLMCRTPDSIMSTGSSHLTNTSWKLPEKLQIVKPIEGSMTLHHWSQLARPSLGSSLDERPRVIARGQSTTSSGVLTRYTLDDLEEDDLDESLCLGKQFESTGMTYTYTNSTVMHPEDHTQVTSSYSGLQMSAGAPILETLTPSNPSLLSRRNSTSTFSTSLGLAKLLNERGITAAVDSPDASTCTTPCNSPERPSSPVSGLYQMGFFASGAEFFRRKLDGSYHKSHKKSTGKEIANIRLVDKIEEIGLESILKPIESSNEDRKLSLQDGREHRRLPDSDIVQCSM